MATADNGLKYYQQGMDLMLSANPNYSRAQNMFEHGTKISTIPCDFYRALGYIEMHEESRTSESTFTKVYQNLDTYGAVESTVNTDRRVGLPSKGTMPIGNFLDVGLQLLGVAFRVSNKPRWVAAAAVPAIRQGDFAVAESILQDGYREAGRGRGTHQILDLISALNFSAARRWGDVISVAQPWLTAADWDALEDIPSDGDTFKAAFSALAGVAHAHLDELTAATSLLNDAAASPYTGALSHANYGLALIARKKGDTETADFHLGRAQSYNPNHEGIRKLVEDPSAGLHITSRETIDKRSSYWDFDTEPNLSAEREAERDADRKRIVDEAMARLDKFIGMDSVKEQVQAVKQAVQFQQIRAQRGMDQDATISLNMIFQGPPGTGKTSVARCLGDIFYGLGVLDRPDVKEVGRSNLVGQYLGSTAKISAEAFQDARGGIFFVDEAYDLVGKSSGGNVDQFGEEALNTLLPLIYNHRDDTCTIFAGYEQDMERLMDVNEGLRSRFNYYITFETYTPEELGEIARGAAKGMNNILTPEAEEVIVEMLTPLYSTRHVNGKPLLDVMGNARCANNIVEAADKHMQKRIMSSVGDLNSLSDEALVTITAEDARLATEEVIARFVKG